MIAIDSAGNEVREGDKIVSFRGETWEFICVTNRNKVYAKLNADWCQELNPDVFKLRLEEPK